MFLMYSPLPFRDMTHLHTFSLVSYNFSFFYFVNFIKLNQLVLGQKNNQLFVVKQMVKNSQTFTVSLSVKILSNPGRGCPRKAGRVSVLHALIGFSVRENYSDPSKTLTKESGSLIDQIF